MSSLRNRPVLCVALLAAWLGTAGPVPAGERRPPNVVLIVSDDQGYRDLGCFGSDEVKTPNLDRLAKQGVCLTSFYAAWPACTPSRGSLLTGRYPQRHGVYDMIRNEAPDYGHRYTPEEYEATFERVGGMDVREVLLPLLLRRAGYVSGIFGKWDLGQLRRYLPPARGFDEFYGFVNTGVDYYTHERYGVPSMYRGNEPTAADRGTYCTDLFKREALKFLQAHHEQPFFLYVPFNAPHNASNLDPDIRSGAQAPAEYKKMYPHLSEELVKATRYGRPAQVASKQARRLRYLAAVTCMDAAIGEILQALDDLGVAGNTVVIFLSDNGGSGDADNGPLRGKKASLFEGGVRVPCIIRYPGHVPAGGRSDAFLTTLDVVPTLLKLAGVEPPPGLKLDGFDMMPALTGKAPPPRTEMFWQRQGDRAARVGNWKWVDSKQGGGLFDLSKDVGEANDLSAEQPGRLRELQAAFSRWRAEMDAAEPRGPFRDY